MPQSRDEPPRPATGARPTPASVDIGDDAVTIVWNDGHRSVYPTATCASAATAPPASARA